MVRADDALKKLGFERVDKDCGSDYITFQYCVCGVLSTEIQFNTFLQTYVVRNKYFGAVEIDKELHKAIAQYLNLSGFFEKCNS